MITIISSGEGPQEPKTAWEYYTNWAEVVRKETVKTIHTDTDTTLIFSGLYAAVLSAFLLDTLGRLQEDPAETTRDILIHQTRMMRDATLGPYEPQPFEPPAYLVLACILLFASLAIILLAAFISMLVRWWILSSYYNLKTLLVIKDPALAYEYLIQGFERYKFLVIIVLLPYLIYASLLLFSCGLIALLLSVHHPSAIAMAVVLGAGALFYGITLSLSIIDPSAPFRSAISMLGWWTLRRLYSLPMDRYYVQWIDFSLRFDIPRWISVFVAKLLLWSPCTEFHLVDFDHSPPLTLNRYFTTHLALRMATSMLNRVYRLSCITPSTSQDVHKLLVTAGSGPMHQATSDGLRKLLKSFRGSIMSLDQARTIATLIAHGRAPRHYSPISEEIEQTVIPLLKSSSNEWDKILAILVSMCTLGTGDDLASCAIPALESEQFTLSQISTILNSIRVHTHYLPWQRASGLLTATRIVTAILRYHRPVIVELVFIFTRFREILHPDSLDEEDVSPDGNIFSPYLHDSAGLTDMFMLLNSFPSFVDDLSGRPGLSKAGGAFAIHFLIRLYRVSPILYWRVMGRTSRNAVQEWAREVAETHMVEAAHIVLHSCGAVNGARGPFSDWQWGVAIQHYDQSLEPMTIDLDWPIVHFTFQESKGWRNSKMMGDSIGPLSTFSNIWLAIHAQTADHRRKLPIPVDQVRWIDHPISEMIALYRLSTYNDGSVRPDPTFLNLFLHSNSFKILLPTVQSHIVWFCEASSYTHGIPILSSSEINLLLKALRVLLGLHLLPDQLSSAWMLVYRLCGTQWARLPDSWRLTFLRIFFSVIDGGGSRSTKPEYLGIKWMQAVWKKVLGRSFQGVLGESVRFVGSEWENGSREIGGVAQMASIPEMELKDGDRDLHLDQPATKMLAILLEAASEHQLVTVDLANAISCSPLLADEWFRRDRISLGRIKTIIHAPLILRPPTPPVENIKLQGAEVEHD